MHKKKGKRERERDGKGCRTFGEIWTRYPKNT